MFDLSDKHANNHLHSDLHIFGSRKSLFSTQVNGDFKGMLKLKNQKANVFICNNHHHHSNKQQQLLFLHDSERPLGNAWLLTPAQPPLPPAPINCLYSLSIPGINHESISQRLIMKAILIYRVNEVSLKVKNVSSYVSAWVFRAKDTPQMIQCHVL